MGKDREAWCAQSMGLQRVRHNLATEQQSFGFSLQHCKCGIQTAVSAVFCAVSSWSCLLVSHQTWLLKTFSLWVHPVLCNGVSVLTFSYFQCQSLRGWRQKELWKTHGPPPCHPPPPRGQRPAPDLGGAAGSEARSPGGVPLHGSPGVTLGTCSVWRFCFFRMG